MDSFEQIERESKANDASTVRRSRSAMTDVAMLQPALVFGRVPLFYFLLHLPLIHALAVIVCYAQNGAAHWMFESPNLGSYPFTAPPGWGLSLPTIYLLWVFVVCLLHPLCR